MDACLFMKEVAWTAAFRDPGLAPRMVSWSLDARAGGRCAAARFGGRRGKKVDTGGGADRRAGEACTTPLFKARESESVFARMPDEDARGHSDEAREEERR